MLKLFEKINIKNNNFEVHIIGQLYSNSMLDKLKKFKIKNIFFHCDATEEEKYNIIKKSNPLLPTILTYMQPNVINSVTMSTIGIAKAVITLPIKNNTNVFSITVNDNITSISATTSLTGVYPYFYGFSDLSDINLVQSS